MKKIIISALAAMSLAACVQEEIVTVNQPSAIAFENAFVDNATRAALDPSTTTNSIEGFNVWGFMDQPSGYVFTGDEVTKNGGVWTYAETQYWAPNHTYYFAAVSPIGGNWEVAGEESNPAEITFTNENGSEDLLYAATSVATPRYEDLVKDGMEPVKFHFNHLLSKVKFTFTNGFTTPNSSVEILNVKMTAPQTGKYTIATESWQPAGNLTLEFGNVARLAATKADECAKERLTIPVDKTYEYQISFTVKLYTGDQPALELDKTATVTGVALEMGKAYNFTAEINPENLHLPSIEFEVVEVKDWVTAETPNVQVQESELKAAAILGGSYTLTDDVVLTSPVVVPAGSHFVLNLGGYTLKNQVANAETDVILVEEGAELVINGEGTVEAVNGNDGYTVISNGKVTINGGTYKAGADENGAANAVVYARGKGQVYVNGGYFPNEYNSVYVLNKKDADRDNTVIEVRGGTFRAFDPANNAAENAGTNFCAEGYTSYADGEYFIVVNGVVVETADEFKAAAANAALEYIIVAADLDFGTSTAVVSTDKVILGNGYKLTAGGTTKGTYYGLGFAGANGTVKDLVMNGGGGIYATNGANLVVENVTLKTNYSKSGRHMFYVSGATLTVNSGNYEVLRTGCKYFSMENGAKAYVTGGTWEDMLAKDAPVYIDNGCKLEISGGKFQVGVANYKFDPTPYLAAGYKAERVGNYMEVSAE